MKYKIQPKPESNNIPCRHHIAREVLVGYCIGILSSSKPDTFVGRVENAVVALAETDKLANIHER